MGPDKTIQNPRELNKYLRENKNSKDLYLLYGDWKVWEVKVHYHPNLKVSACAPRFANLWQGSISSSGGSVRETRIVSPKPSCNRRQKI